LGGRGIRTIRIEVSVSSPPDLVWWAWTKFDRVTAWFAPEANVEARPGGPFELFFDPADHEHQRTRGFVFTLVEPKKRLGFTWKGPPARGRHLSKIFDRLHVRSRDTA